MGRVLILCVMILSCTALLGVEGACLNNATALQAAIGGAQLGEVLTVCRSFNISTTIDITRPVTINGTCGTSATAPCTLRPAAEGVRLFEVPEGVGVVYLNNLVLAGADVMQNDGALLLAGAATSVVVNGVTFQDSRAQYGGAVHSYGNITFNQCVFLNNSATTDGGALYVQGPGTTIFRSNFEYNNAKGDGGAMHVWGTSKLVFISQCFFFGNIATDRGGAMLVEDGPIALLSSSNFTGNSGAKGGGAVFMAATEFRSTGNTFNNNVAPRGGAVFVSSSRIANFCGSTNFTGNTALQAGQGDSVFVERNADNGVANFCPGLPAGLFTAEDGLSNATCSGCTCAATTCDPNATCFESRMRGAQCSCNAGFRGNGFRCSASSTTTNSTTPAPAATTAATAAPGATTGATPSPTSTSTATGVPVPTTASSTTSGNTVALAPTAAGNATSTASSQLQGLFAALAIASTLAVALY